MKRALCVIALLSSCTHLAAGPDSQTGFQLAPDEDVDYAISPGPGSGAMAAPVLLRGLDSCPYRPATGKVDRDGDTVLRAQVDHRGHAVQVVVTSSSGSEELDRAALKCLLAARFRPAMMGGSNVPVDIQFTWRWRAYHLAPHCSASMPVRRNVVVYVSPTQEVPDKAETVVCFCRKESGEMEGPVMVRSSGSARLDEGGISLAKQSSQRAPSGKPSSGHAGCEAYRIRFTKRANLPTEKNN